MRVRGSVCEREAGLASLVMQPTTCKLVSLRAGAAPVVDVGFTSVHYHTGCVGTQYCWSKSPFIREPKVFLEGWFYAGSLGISISCLGIWAAATSKQAAMSQKVKHVWNSSPLPGIGAPASPCKTIAELRRTACNFRGLDLTCVA